MTQPIISNQFRLIARDSDFLDRKLGSRGEVYFDRDTNTLRLYDSETQGGQGLAKDNLDNVSVNDFVDTQYRSKSGIVEYTVTINNIGDGNKYVLNGEYRPELDFVVGYTYVFNQNDPQNVYYPNPTGGANNQHPLNFSADDPNGELGNGTLYTDGVVYKLDGVVVNKAEYWAGFESASTRQVRITVSNDTPSTLYYWCQNHLNMGHVITVSNPGTGSGGNSFATIRAAGQTDVVAESSQDFVTFASTGGISISTDAATDTITFADTGVIDILAAGDGISVTDDSAGTYSITNTGVISLEAGNGIDIVDDSAGNLTIGTSILDFKNFAVAGQTTISAGQIDDTITFKGSNITITTDEEEKSITFSTPAAVTEAFTRITVAGQSDVVADQASDSFQLVAGPNVSISTSPGGDSITISATAGVGGAGGVSTGEANRLARYASTGQVVQDSGENLTFDGTVLILNGSPVVTEATETKTEFFLAADDSTIRLVRDQESVKFIGGTGITTASDIDGNITITNTLSDQNLFSTVAVAGQNSIVADTTSDTLTFAAGSNITITTDDTTDTVTISAAGGGVASNSFETIAVAGQSDVVAESSTDTLTLVAGTGITLTTDAGTDSITIAGSNQNLFETVSADTGSTTANSTTDTLTVSGGTDITTSISGDTLTIAYSGSSGVSTFDGLTDVSTAGIDIDKIYLQAITRLVVDNSGTSAYTFDQYSGNNPTIFAINGTTIAFDLDAIGGHPFLIQTAAGANYNTGLVHVNSSGTVNTGSSAQGQQSGTLYWKIPSSISGNYRYQCSIHGAMVGTITIKDFTAI